MTAGTRSPIWHPFTQHGLEPNPVEITRAKGAWLETAAGEQVFDAISSWWVTTHGHSEPAISAAIAAAAGTLDQIIFAGFTHDAAETVARELVAMTPPGLSHVFFSDSGSTSVEVALKMALGYWRNRSESRHRIIALEHAYHGDTVGTMSAGARGVFNAAYAPLLFDVVRMPAPLPGSETAALEHLDALCRDPSAAAFICEPLVLGAGGMLMYSAETLAEMHAICARHGVLFIADEVMTGFGRTGTAFAVEQANITPDILCLAKGLTGGALPLAATLCKREIFDAHVSDDRARMFFHSSSYTANPIACAAAAANLKLWSSGVVMPRVADLCAAQAACARAFIASRQDIEILRQCGTILAFDLIRSNEAPGDGYLSDIALPLRKAALKHGVLLRPLGGTVYVMPPYCTTAVELSTAYMAICAAIDEVLT